MSNLKPLLEAVIEVDFILKSKQKKPFAFSFNCAASALLPLVVWWGCEILDLPTGALEYQALGLGEEGHSVSTLTAGLCVPDSKYAYCLGKVSVAHSHLLKLSSSFPQVSLCSVIPGAYFN